MVSEKGWFRCCVQVDRVSPQNPPNLQAKINENIKTSTCTSSFTFVLCAASVFGAD